jgi:rubrerythrin
MKTRAVSFGVGQILEIAEKLEHNGSQFYKGMAKLFSDARCWNLCQDLSDWRAGRELALAQRRKRLYEREAELGPNDTGDYFQSHPDIMADLTVFADKLYPRHTLTGRESRSEIVKEAVAKTEDAIAFYRGLKAFARNQEARAVLDQVIAEEQRYMRVLGEKVNYSQCF